MKLPRELKTGALDDINLGFSLVLAIFRGPDDQKVRGDSRPNSVSSKTCVSSRLKCDVSVELLMRFWKRYRCRNLTPQSLFNVVPAAHQPTFESTWERLLKRTQTCQILKLARHS
ncbi:hypothetical protein AVEN_274166-1 [Araneus ventricosus]|uniref:Uncharacterized protein n=1 Tax=Araneus ventricosus TaxID=182803 RepID=A0A4Y2U3K1_ARAVE|nr:hypothetical protein AVEN_274166-1 [Araneus ventricosus]